VLTPNFKQYNLQRTTFGDAVVINHKQNLKDLHFFPGKALSKTFLHSVCQGVNNRLNFVVCLGEMSMFPNITITQTFADKT
jgi:hypothetical protein